MNIALFGATGGTGKALIEQAIGAGHSVQALVRDVSKVNARDGLSIVEGDARDADCVAATLSGATVAISTLGNFNRKPNTEISDATRCVVEAMERSGPKRLIVVSTIGVGNSYKPLKSFIFKHIVIGMAAKHIWRDRARQEDVITGSSLDWTIARPGGLKDMPKTDTYRVIPGGAEQPKKIMIGRPDVADFCLKAAQDNSYVKQAVCLFY